MCKVHHSATRDASDRAFDSEQLRLLDEIMVGHRHEWLVADNASHGPCGPHRPDAAHGEATALTWKNVEIKNGRLSSSSKSCGSDTNSSMSMLAELVHVFRSASHRARQDDHADIFTKPGPLEDLSRDAMLVHQRGLGTRTEKVSRIDPVRTGLAKEEQDAVQVCLPWQWRENPCVVEQQIKVDQTCSRFARRAAARPRACSHRRLARLSLHHCGTVRRLICMSLTLASPLPARIGDFALGRGIWLLLLAQFLATMPASATGIFLPAMAADLGSDAAVVGGLRGLGGIAALICGVLAAPLIDRIARALTISSALLLLAGGAFLAAYGSVASVAVFFALAGAAGALSQPAIQSAAADGHDAVTGARAASMVTASGALSPMLAGPLLAVPALFWGWRGDFVAVAISCVLIAVVAGATLDRRPPAGLVHPAYLLAFRLVGGAPGAVPLLLGSTFRGILQFAWLTYLAAFLVERFGASTAELAATWTLGGLSFFILNLAVARAIGSGSTGWRARERLIAAGLVALVVLTPAGLLAPTLPLAIVLAGLTAGAHGAIVAGTISLVVAKYTPIRGAVLGLNAAGANLGLFAGAAIGAVALAWAGYSGLTVTLAVLACATAAAFAWALRGAPRPRATPFAIR